MVPGGALQAGRPAAAARGRARRRSARAHARRPSSCGRRRERAREAGARLCNGTSGDVEHGAAGKRTQRMGRRMRQTCLCDGAVKFQRRHCARCSADGRAGVSTCGCVSFQRCIEVWQPVREPRNRRAPRGGRGGRRRRREAQAARRCPERELRGGAQHCSGRRKRTAGWRRRLRRAARSVASAPRAAGGAGGALGVRARRMTTRTAARATPPPRVRRASRKSSGFGAPCVKHRP